MSPYREHQIERPEGWWVSARGALVRAVRASYPYSVALAIVGVLCGGTIAAINAGLVYQTERGVARVNEARTWATSVGFNAVGVYCYNNSDRCDVSVVNADGLRALQLHCVPGQGCVPR